MFKTCSIMILALLGTTPVQADQFTGPILPEVTTAVDLSSSDVNRIVCPGTINDLIFSKEKGIEGHFVGSNAFVKFAITVQDDEKHYSNTPSELFVSCNNTIYTLIATPKRIPSVTLRLAPSPSQDLKQNIDHYQTMPFEKKVLQLVREAYLQEYPESYRITAADEEVNISADLTVRLKKIVDVEGVGLRLKEYLVRSAVTDSVKVTEKDFLKSELGERIIAVVVEDHSIGQGKSSRVFIVEQRGEDS
ncbi:MAG: type-F conjugative transfer system secretin TraK [Proteobacteria bacterium]|nr:type-F conjugative transfer system secretin TraK [Pseudomonadota bacterium]